MSDNHERVTVEVDGDDLAELLSTSPTGEVYQRVAEALHAARGTTPPWCAS